MSYSSTGSSLKKQYWLKLKNALQSELIMYLKNNHVEYVITSTSEEITHLQCSCTSEIFEHLRKSFDQFIEGGEISTISFF